MLPEVQVMLVQPCTKLLDKGYKVTVLDLMIYGEDVLPSHPSLTLIKGDIRNRLY